MKPISIDHDTVREMLRTATPDRVLRFIGQRHPAHIALLFKGLRAIRDQAAFRYPLLGVLASAMIFNLGLMAGFSGPLIPLVLNALSSIRPWAAASL